jgi:glycosyltransferase involved in cell wall biosynthesis
MKIVLLSAFYEPFMSGAEQLVKELAERLGSEHEIVVVTARLDRHLPRREERPFFKLRRVGLGHKSLDKFLYPVLAAWSVWRLKPDIVHAVMESYAGGALVLVKFFCPRQPTVLTLQSGDLDSPEKQGRFLIRRFQKVIHRTPDHLTAISHFLAERAIRLGVPATKITVIPNGVDLSRLPPKPPLLSSTRQVICIARLSWEKGLAYLLRAWPAVSQVFPEARLVLVGAGPERAALEQLVVELGIKSTVEFRGALPHAAALAEMARSEVFVCPSLAEGLGIVFIEAQACGVPVIGTRVGGIPEVIEHEETGLLVPPRDVEALGQALIRLLSDRDLAHRLAAEAERRVPRFDWTNIVEQFRVVYRGLLGHS